MNAIKVPGLVWACGVCLREYGNVYGAKQCCECWQCGSPRLSNKRCYGCFVRGLGELFENICEAIEYNITNELVWDKWKREYD